MTTAIQILIWVACTGLVAYSTYRIGVGEGEQAGFQHGIDYQISKQKLIDEAQKKAPTKKTTKRKATKK